MTFPIRMLRQTLARASARSALAAVLGAMSFAAPPRADAADLTATVVDRKGVTHTVRKIEVSGSSQLEYYVDGRRRQVPLEAISRFRIAGASQAEQAPIVVTLRSGRTEEGTIVIAAGVTPHDDVVAGSGYVSDRITGSTDLGPLFLPLSDVQEVILHHPEGEVVAAEAALKATIVDMRGRRYDVMDLRYRGEDAFQYTQGRKKRRVELRHVDRLQFGDSAGGEVRPVTITYRNGKVIQGEVDASTVRLAGEVDHIYYARVDSAFTGRQASGVYAIGLQNVKLVLLHAEEADGEEADTASPAADTTAAPADSTAP